MIVVPDPAAAAFAFVDSGLLVRMTRRPVASVSAVEVPSLQELDSCGPPSAGPFRIGRLGDREAVALALPSQTTCGDFESKGLRELFGLITEPVMAMAARAFQTLEWSLSHAFCGRCGSATVFSQTEPARICPSCEAAYYPRITPAVITLVRKGHEILLARGRRFGPQFYSLIAGFVEPGETLEQAVEREVREEVGIEVRDITYFASQSWPFPSQMMVGFTANHASGELRIDEAELSDARWFRIDALPGDIQIPTTFSISGRLIRSALGGGEVGD